MENSDIDELVRIVSQELSTAINSSYQSSPVRAAQETLSLDNIGIDVSYDNFGNLISIGADRITSQLGTAINKKEIAKYIDHTLLKPESTTQQIRQLCQEAKDYQFCSVCVNPGHVELCSNLLAGSGVNVCTVIGFPLGATTSKVKAFEAEDAINNGANELDMVINIGAIKERDLDRAGKDVETVVKVGHARNALVKVIIETALLTYDEKIFACLVSKAAGADFVKTSTGFSTGGATSEDIHLMRRAVGPDMGVKAAGGVRSLPKLISMVQSGSTRIGATVGVKIMQEIDQGASQIS